jgi:hypothetical protein
MPTIPRNQSIITRSAKQNQSTNNQACNRQQTPVVDDSSIDEDTPLSLLSKVKKKHPGQPKLLTQQQINTNFNPSTSDCSSSPTHEESGKNVNFFSRA